MLPAKTTVLRKISKNTEQTSTATILEGFGIGSSQSFQNPWGFLRDESNKSVFCYVIEVTFGKHLRVGTYCPVEPNMWLEGARGKGLETNYSYQRPTI